MKVLIDMCFPPRWVELLEKAGINAVHWSTLGRGDAPDSEIMKFAADKRYAVLTHDLDFGAILAATKGKRPSVVQVRAKDISPDATGARVIAALRQVEAELEIGALLTIDTYRDRLRLLPL
jgi:predicted nuclease of predicted toxin-antitoxin system